MAASLVQLCEWADDYDIDRLLTSGAYVSTFKYDGIRAVWDGRKYLWSRWGNQFHVPESFRRRLPKDIVLDGELTVPGGFQNTASVVRSHSASWAKVTFNVFEAVPPEIWWMPRVIHDAKRQPVTFPGAPDGYDVPKGCWNYMRGVELAAEVWPDVVRSQTVAKTPQDAVALGYEGLVYRFQAGIWRPSRNANALKDKPVLVGEGCVVGVTEGKGRFKGMIGALVLAYQGKQFNLSGLNVEERNRTNWVGKTVQFMYRELTDGGIPKDARYLRGGQ